MGIVQEFCSKPFRIVTHDETQMKIAKEKLKKQLYTVLHIDSTVGFFDKIEDQNVSYSVACFSGW